MISEAEFLSRLARAVGQITQGVEPVKKVGPGNCSSSLGELCLGWAKDMEIYIPDPSHGSEDVGLNPVIRAMIERSTSPFATLTLDDLARIKAAWEYFDGKQEKGRRTFELDVLNRSIEELFLSVRSYNRIKNMGILTIGELVQKTEMEMLGNPGNNFGRQSLNEVKTLLEELGLSLGMKID